MKIRKNRSDAIFFFEISLTIDTSDLRVDFVSCPEIVVVKTMNCMLNCELYVHVGKFPGLHINGRGTSHVVGRYLESCVEFIYNLLI